VDGCIDVVLLIALVIPLLFLLFCCPFSRVVVTTDIAVFVAESDAVVVVVVFACNGWLINKSILASSSRLNALGSLVTILYNSTPRFIHSKQLC